MAANNTMPATIATGNLPAHLQLGSNAGNENVSTSDLQIPRLKLLQKISPELEEGHEKFVKGAKAGQFYNTVTGKTVEEMYVINMHFARGYSVFKKRANGGGFFGEFGSEAEATEAMVDAGEDPSQFDVAENHRHMLLLLDADGNIDMPALMDFTSTKIRTSKAWNSDIQVNAAGSSPRFGLVYRLHSTKQSNAKGTWHGVGYEFAGFASEELFTKAKEQYEKLVSGESE